MSTLESFDERLDQLEKAVRLGWERSTEVAHRLSAARRYTCRELAHRVERELATLSMGRAHFEVILSPLGELGRGPNPGALSTSGADQVEFHLAANPGEPARPLAKVASGGELSRLLLALKHCLAGAGDVGTFVFDEVDSGIGGAVAEVMGQKLQTIAARRQVICISHLAQIAAFGSRHFRVAKDVVDGRTSTGVEVLDEVTRVEELARMLGGLHITERTREHARELLERCQSYQPTPLEKPWQHA